MLGEKGEESLLVEGMRWGSCEEPVPPMLYCFVALTEACPASTARFPARQHSPAGQEMDPGTISPRENSCLTRALVPSPVPPLQSSRSS